MSESQGGKREMEGKKRGREQNKTVSSRLTLARHGGPLGVYLLPQIAASVLLNRLTLESF